MVDGLETKVENSNTKINSLDGRVKANINMIEALTDRVD